MSVPARLALFTATLALVFAASALAGSAIDPDPKADSPSEHAGDAPHAGKSPHGAATHEVRGLTTEADGLRLVIENPELRRGETERLAFRIVDDRGETVSDF